MAGERRGARLHAHLAAACVGWSASSCGRIWARMAAGLPRHGGDGGRDRGQCLADAADARPRLRRRGTRRCCSSSRRRGRARLRQGRRQLRPGGADDDGRPARRRRHPARALRAADARRPRLLPRQSDRHADLALHQRRQHAAQRRHQRAGRARQGGGDGRVPGRADVLSGLAAGARRVRRRFRSRSRPISRVGRRMRRVSANTQVETRPVHDARSNQTFQGARHVKAYGMEAYETRRAGQRHREPLPPRRARGAHALGRLAADGDAGRHRGRARHPLWRPPGDRPARARRARSSRSSPRCCWPISR